MVGQHGATVLVLMIVCAVGSWGCHCPGTAPIHGGRATCGDGESSAAATSAARCVSPIDSVLSPSPTPAPGPAPEPAAEPTPAPLPPPVVQGVYLEVEVDADDVFEVGLVDLAR